MTILRIDGEQNVPKPCIHDYQVTGQLPAEQHLPAPGTGKATILSSWTR